MPRLSEEILSDLASAYTSEQVLDLLEIDTQELLSILIDQLEDNLHKFELRPVDCNDL